MIPKDGSLAYEDPKALCVGHCEVPVVTQSHVGPRMLDP